MSASVTVTCVWSMPSSSATMSCMAVSEPQPTSCRLAQSTTLPSSFIFSVMVLKSGKSGVRMPFLCAPQARPTPTR